MLISVWNTRFQRETSRSFLYQGRNKHAIFFVGDTSRLLCYFQHFMILKYYTDMGNLLFCRGTLADRYVLFHLLCCVLIHSKHVKSDHEWIIFHQTLCSHEAFRQNRARIILTITLWCHRFCSVTHLETLGGKQFVFLDIMWPRSNQ